MIKRKFKARFLQINFNRRYRYIQVNIIIGPLWLFYTLTKWDMSFQFRLQWSEDWKKEPFNDL